MTVKVKDVVFDIDCEISSVYDKFQCFEIPKVETVNFLIIKSNYIKININDYKKEINGLINTSDLYPIINNVIGYCINDKDNLYIHSVLVSKDNIGYLLLGDFKAGKSTLANTFSSYGYELNSADQTWINQKYMVLGSSYNKTNGIVTYIDNDKCNKNIKISKIFIIRAICENGNVYVEGLDNRNYYIKNIFKYCNWHYDMPIMSSYTKLYDSGNKILSFLNNLHIPCYMIRGDAKKIVEVIINDREEMFE